MMKSKVVIAAIVITVVSIGIAIAAINSERTIKFTSKIKRSEFELEISGQIDERRKSKK